MCGRTLMLAVALSFCGTNVVYGQAYRVIHTFTGASDGAAPQAGVTVDRAGNLYGTASVGGVGFGTVYKLTRGGTNWVVMPLYNFAGGIDGEFPQAGVVIGANGTLYGTTTFGGAPGWGTVFNVAPAANACTTALCPWKEAVLYSFQGGSDGGHPRYGDLTFDTAGNAYGTTYDEGHDDSGTVFQLRPSGDGWTEDVLYRFLGASDGKGPMSGLIFDNTGNLYGTTFKGGQFALGTIFQLQPSGSSWTESVLYSFTGQDDGDGPIGGLVVDPSGNLLGTTADGVSNGGAAFKMTAQDNDGWTFTALYQWSYPGDYDCPGPWSNLTMDAAGNLYGTAIVDGAYWNGSVFKLAPSDSGWTYTDLHDFTGGSDGGLPVGGVALDATGNLYGTTSAGGTTGLGVVWEITP